MPGEEKTIGMKFFPHGFAFSTRGFGEDEEKALRSGLTRACAAARPNQYVKTQVSPDTPTAGVDLYRFRQQ
jgi:hypothetical protein